MNIVSDSRRYRVILGGANLELKNYQKKVLNDLRDYLEILEKDQDPRHAFSVFWSDRGILATDSKIPIYHGLDPKAPDVCIKVPTGGGKTFIACASIKEIFDRFPIKNKIVIWMVPNSAIYQQTRAAFMNPDHPYRQRLDIDFNGNVCFYDYEELLQGQGFNPQTIRDQLSLCVISYAAVRSNTKDGRRMYRSNSNLMSFGHWNLDNDDFQDGPSLSDVLSGYNPVVVLDESHNALSELSRRALRDLDPSFILELTATPKPESNVISFVSASALKEENMVKIPVFLFGRQGLRDVLTSTILYREKLEENAIAEQRISGRYVRPIALIQAEPKNDDDSVTFERIRKKLLSANIPEEHIALKLSGKDELKNVDLLSPDCNIRYIITVNALREGWDCPFAYILCTLAAGNSKIEVEQIIGRILRQPGAKRFNDESLNASYVFSSRDSFQETMNSVAKGLMDSGFSRKDYRTVADRQMYFDVGEELIDNVSPPIHYSVPGNGNKDSFDDQLDSVDLADMRDPFHNDPVSSVSPDAMADDIRKRMSERNEEPKQHESEEVPNLMTDRRVSIKDNFREDALSTRIPYLMYTNETPLEKYSARIYPEGLGNGFDVSVRCNTDIGETFVDDNMGKLDSRKDNPDVLAFTTLQEKERDSVLSVVAPDKLSDDQLSKRLVEDIFKSLSPMNNVKDPQLKIYLQNFASKPRDTLILYTKYINQVISELKKKIDAELKRYREEKFNELLSKQSIFCNLDGTKDSYVFPERIDPRNGQSIPQFMDKSLYEYENRVSGFEQTMLTRIMSCESVLWWHRIVERGQNEFCINGFINHYPDFVVKTKKGNIVMIETKGSHLDNPDTKLKIKLGREWANRATSASKDGHTFSYFMVFEDDNRKAEGSISANTMIQYLNDL